MSDACDCVDGHKIDCSNLHQYRFPPPSEHRIRRYRDHVKRFFHTTFLQVAVFCVAICCICCHFDYLKMRARGRLSRWVSVPEWKVLREDKDGHELGSVEQLYEPVEEHRRVAIIALMGENYSTGPGHHSQSQTLLDTPRGSSERGGTTWECAAGVLRLPPDISPESLAAIQEFAEHIHRMNMSKNAEVSSDPCTPSPAQTQQAGPSRTNTSPSPPFGQFSQYSIHPDSPEPSDRNLVPTTTPSKMRELKLPPLSLTPSRKSRSFKASAHSRGNTVWMATASYEDLPGPPEPVPEDEPGVLYIHRNLMDNTLQVWLLGNEKRWVTMQLGVKTQHPTLGDRYLAVRLDGTPSWTTFASWNTAHKWVNGR